MTDIPTYELVERMIQACKNIIFATSGVNSPEDVAKDEFAIENMENCMSIILESYEILDNEMAKDYLASIEWAEKSTYKQALSKQEKNDDDFKQLYRLCKDAIPTLQQKLETVLNNL
ncbi:MAG: hypothetical protein K6F33_05385 [Bacteroidales bacterium]|nr:hypothetical protein [Bacteroidales bacterium]